VFGQIISRTGHYKRWMVLGAVLLTTGLGLMCTLTASTSFVLMGVYLLLVGMGTGMLMQNLVLIVQNEVPVTEMGAASATVAFFRSMGGAIGVSVLGAVLGTRVSNLMASGIVEQRVPASELALLADGLPEPAAVKTFPEPIHSVVADAFAGGVSQLFLISGALAVIAIIAVALLKERPLGTSTAVEMLAEAEASGELHGHVEFDDETGSVDRPVPAGSRTSGKPALALD
jgi:MFS family permease